MRIGCMGGDCCEVGLGLGHGYKRDEQSAGSLLTTLRLFDHPDFGGRKLGVRFRSVAKGQSHSGEGEREPAEAGTPYLRTPLTAGSRFGVPASAGSPFESQNLQ